MQAHAGMWPPSVMFSDDCVEPSDSVMSLITRDGEPEARGLRQAGMSAVVIHLNNMDEKVAIELPEQRT